MVYVDHQALLERGYYWPGMRDDVAEYVKTCLVCQQGKVERDRLLGLLEPLPVPQRPWESVPIDFLAALPKVGEYGSILVVVDRLTKYAHFFPLSHPQQQSLRSLSIISSNCIECHTTLNCQRQGTRSSLAISGRSSFEKKGHN